MEYQEENQIEKEYSFVFDTIDALERISLTSLSRLELISHDSLATSSGALSCQVSDDCVSASRASLLACCNWLDREYFRSSQYVTSSCKIL